MRRFLRVDIADELIVKGTRQGLFDSLYAQGQLKLEYDTLVTKNAAQAFATRSGNCLSLVIMTAAFAKELGLPVRFQRAVASETWSRSGNVQYFVGHVNLTLGVKSADVGFGRASTDQMTIDFLPPQETRGMSTRVTDEKTIVAMYMNNRAAEAFTLGNMNDAYWWARGAILESPQFMSSFNTLGVIYQRTGHLPEAEASLAYALEREPMNTRVMLNLASVLEAEGRTAESVALTRRLEQIEPDPPFRYVNLGMAALRKGDYRTARDLFRRKSIAPVQRRVPLLACDRRRRAGRYGIGAAGARQGAGVQLDTAGPRYLRRQARPDTARQQASRRTPCPRPDPHRPATRRPSRSGPRGARTSASSTR